MLDGETVVLGPDGVSDFASLHSGRHNERAHLYAFDMLAGDGEDQRQLPLSLRKTNLARLLKRSSGPSPAYSSLSTSRAKSAGTYSASPIVWALKASFRSAARAPIRPANAGTG